MPLLLICVEIQRRSIPQFWGKGVCLNEEILGIVMRVHISQTQERHRFSELVRSVEALADEEKKVSLWYQKYVIFISVAIPSIAEKLKFLLFNFSNYLINIHYRTTQLETRIIFLISILTMTSIHHIAVCHLQRTLCDIL